jgi:hypothetical protein
MAVPVQTRQETPERWQKALSRAISHNLATTGSCTCPAGRGGDPVCCHRALVRALTGTMPVDTPADCPACCGCGVVTYRTFEERCTTCGGSGVRPNHHLHDVPPAPMVAAAA